MSGVTAALIAGGAALVGTVGGALISGKSAKKAANTQAEAANQATQSQLQMYERTRADLAPFMAGGNSAFSQLANIFGFGGGMTANGQQVGAAGGQPNPQLATELLTKFPGYQFGFDQGNQALDRSAAAGGRLLSGAQLQDSQKFGHDYAMQQAWQPYVSELNWAAGLGENAAAGAGNIGSQTAQGVANTQLGAGQATAAGQIAQGNNWATGLSQLGQTVGNVYSSYANPYNGGGAWNPYANGYEFGPQG